jgi:hypothetical protein
MNKQIIDFVKTYLKIDPSAYVKCLKADRQKEYIKYYSFDGIDMNFDDDMLRIIFSYVIPDRPHEFMCGCGEIFYAKCNSVCYLSITAVCKQWNKITRGFLVKKLSDNSTTDSYDDMMKNILNYDNMQLNILLIMSNSAVSYYI